MGLKFSSKTGKPYFEVFVQALTILDELVKSRKTPFFVIPAKAGIQFFQLVTEFLDSGFHRSDDFLRNHHTLNGYNFSFLILGYDQNI